MNQISVHRRATAYRHEQGTFVFGTATSKMEGQDPTSPLLCLRPDFLGAGKGNSISIFFELCKLSRVSTSVMENSGIGQSLNEVDGDILQDAAAQQCTLAMACSEQPIQTNSTITSDPCHQVFELDSNGKPLKTIEYQLNSKTILLFQTLTNLKISFRTEVYKPKENRLNVDPNILYCKNLFLKDRKGKFFLFICHEDINVDIKKLRRTLNAYRNFNFAIAADMVHLLGVEPGGVTPLALMAKQAAEVTMVICKSLFKEGSTLMFHPMDSNIATEVTMTDLLKFLKHFNHPVFVVNSLNAK